MILQSLHKYYTILAEDPDSGIAMSGYTATKVSHVLVINDLGQILDVYPLCDTKGSKSVPKTLILPERLIRRNICANYLCDDASYAIGQVFVRDEETKTKKRQVSQEKFDNFKQKNLDLLKDTPGREAQALRNYLSSWIPDEAENHAVLSPHLDDLLNGNTIVFQLDGASVYIHETPEIKQLWESHVLMNTPSTSVDSTKPHQTDDGKEIWGQCLITGQNSPVTRVHNTIKGVPGAKPSGALLVSFDKTSFQSYNKKQSYNAPISTDAAFAYTTVLNYLLNSENNRMRMPDMTVVFWASKPGAQKENNLLAWSLDPIFVEEIEDGENGEVSRADYATAREAKKIFDRVRQGKHTDNLSVDLGVQCYVLGLGPNAARLSVRLWQVNTLGDIISMIASHYNDMDIVGLERWGGMVSPYWTLRALAVREDPKRIPPQLEGQLLKSILTGCMYPQTMLVMALNRCRSGGEYGGVTEVRAAVIKAFLLRKDRIQRKYDKEKGVIRMSLNESHPSAGYQLGRLFSLLEKVQRDAIGKNINATIRDRYFSSASTSPNAVFPLLLKLAQHHIKKSKYGGISDRKIRDVLDQLDVFPSLLSLDEQGLFMLGYYHQNQDHYSKNKSDGENFSDTCEQEKID